MSPVARGGAHREPAARDGLRPEGDMYICLCNAITDGQVRAAAASGARRPKDVFARCGCGAQCAGCMRAILAILREGRAASSPA